MELLYILLVLLILTRAFGALAERVGQPALVGELIAGVALGTAVRPFEGRFPVLAHLGDNEVFHALTELGIFFLMLLAGVELRPSDLTSGSRRSVFVALGGMALPLLLGFGLMWMVLPAWPSRPSFALFLGVSLAITAVPVAIQVLRELDAMRTDLGRLVVSAALLDDVLSLALLAVLTSVLQTGAAPDATGLGLIALKVVAFSLVVVVIGKFVMPLVGRGLRRLHNNEIEFSALLIVALAFGLLAELLGMHFLIGAFAAGLFFGRSTVDAAVFEGVKDRLSALVSGLLAPIFFASIGYHMDLSAVTEIPGFVLLLLLLATLGKLVGAGLPAMLSGLGLRQGAAVGAAMNARGAVELVIANVALDAGLFDGDDSNAITENLYSAVVIMAVTTTLVTPALLKRLLADRESGSDGEDADESARA